MTAPILVTGGTGTLGRRVVSRLRDGGCDVRILSRRPGRAEHGIEFMIGDLTSGEGIEAAVAGVDTIVHCAGGARGDDEKTRHLVRAASQAGGAPHLVYISVVGADRIPVESRIDRGAFGYFAAKRAAEVVISGSGMPWTTLRATQFHQSIFMLFQQMAKLPVMPAMAGVRFQPVGAQNVAERLAELSLGKPSGLVPDIAGPRAYEMTVLIRLYLTATNRRRAILPIKLPGAASRAVRAGANLAPEQSVGPTWEEFLAAQRGHANPNRRVTA